VPEDLINTKLEESFLNVVAEIGGPRAGELTHSPPRDIKISTEWHVGRLSCLRFEDSDEWQSQIWVREEGCLFTNSYSLVFLGLISRDSCMTGMSLFHIPSWGPLKMETGPLKPKWLWMH